MHWYLLPFSFLYLIVVSLRNKFFDWEWIKSSSFNIPIISVGNISVGGTGKTPHIEFLISLLNKNYALAIISRGYKRKTKGYLEVSTLSKTTQVGDEPLQIKKKYKDVAVVVDEKRVHAVETLLSKNKKPEVILLDDAYQHRHITPGLNILLIDYNRPITKDFMLPAGRLREQASNSDRADVVIVTKCPEDMNPIDFRIMSKELNLFPYQQLFFTSFAYNHLSPLFNNTAKIKNIEDLNGKSVLIVTGIANPKPLYKKIKQVGANIKTIEYSDHYEFKIADINKIVNTYMGIKEKSKVILCTEKDAVRLKSAEFSKQLSNLPIYSIPIEVSFLNNEEAKFQSLIENYINCSLGIKS